MTTLVTYATLYGSTQEVAEFIAEHLRTNGHSVELQPMEAVTSLDTYSAVILGAPIYIGKWHKNAQEFLDTHQEALMARPLAAFALGPLSDEPGEMEGVRKQWETHLAEYPWFKPVTQKIFVGKFDPKHLKLTHKMLMALPASPLHGKPASDNRDWNAIRTWADALPAALAVQA